MSYASRDQFQHAEARFYWSRRRSGQLFKVKSLYTPSKMNQAATAENLNQTDSVLSSRMMEDEVPARLRPP